MASARDERFQGGGQMMSADLRDEIARRYGVTVPPDLAVTVVPRGVSGRTTPVWDPKTGHLVSTDGGSWRDVKRRVSAKQAKFARVETRQTVDRHAQLQALFASGVTTVPDLAAALAVSGKTVYRDLRILGLEHTRPAAVVRIKTIKAAKQPRLPKPPRTRRVKLDDGLTKAQRQSQRQAAKMAARRADMAAAFAAGQTTGEIAAAFGVPIGAVYFVLPGAQRTEQAKLIASLLATQTYAEIGQSIGMTRKTVAVTVCRLRREGLLPADFAPPDTRVTDASGRFIG
jgi:hypothetical protein